MLYVLVIHPNREKSVVRHASGIAMATINRIKLGLSRVTTFFHETDWCKKDDIKARRSWLFLTTASPAAAASAVAN